MASFTMGPLLLSTTSKKVFIADFNFIFEPNVKLITTWLYNAGHTRIDTPHECDVQIVLLPKPSIMADPCITPTILVSTEQPMYPSHDPGIIVVAHTIWCMDVVDMNYYHSVFHVPLSKLCIVPTMFGTYENARSCTTTTLQTTVHALQFGSMHDRRIAVMSRLQEDMPGKCVINTDTLVDADPTLRCTRLVLALHYYSEPNVFGLHRIMNVMQYPQVRVLVEDSVGSVYTRALMQQFGDRIVIVKYEELVSTAKDMIESDAICPHAVTEAPACVQKLLRWDGQTSWLRALNCYYAMKDLVVQAVNSRFLDACKCPSDINEHVDTIRLYASRCNSVVELAACTGPSTWGCLQGLMETAVLHDDDRTNVKPFFVGTYTTDATIVCHDAALTDAIITMQFRHGDVLKLEPVHADMLFIDTFHVYGQLKRELGLHASGTKKYILLHDTTIDGDTGELMRYGWNPDSLSIQTEIPACELVLGIWQAVTEFLDSNSDWKLIERFHNNNGLTVLERMS